MKDLRTEQYKTFINGNPYIFKVEFIDVEWIASANNNESVVYSCMSSETAALKLVKSIEAYDNMEKIRIQNIRTWRKQNIKK
jgi:hypothetical protein